MITKQQAMTCREFHYGECYQNPPGPRGGKGQVHMQTWRANGRCQTWRTRPLEFKLPIKYGFNGPYGYITQSNADEYHTHDDCPVVRKWESAFEESLIPTPYCEHVASGNACVICDADDIREGN